MKFKLPSWLRRDELKLPPWAKVQDSHMVDDGRIALSIAVDTDGYVKEWFALLGVEPANADQYWLEVAYQCAKLDIQMAIEGTKYDPRTAGKATEIVMNRAAHWQQKLHPAGKGSHAATKGLEAREHYRRIRGRLPF